MLQVFLKVASKSKVKGVGQECPTHTWRTSGGNNGYTPTYVFASARA
ncbi:MAG TPA: hypothetical protein VEU11_11155 [Terriglobales bacterium]|nr:hypothetical protein [Terriglobales bacterium]